MKIISSSPTWLMTEAAAVKGLGDLDAVNQVTFEPQGSRWWRRCPGGSSGLVQTRQVTNVFHGLKPTQKGNGDNERQCLQLCLNMKWDGWRGGGGAAQFPAGTQTRTRRRQNESTFISEAPDGARPGPGSWNTRSLGGTARKG
ncbi:unnamed protein product [Pleuronectes platessa]|uniref:Uncharacterized protein n=1 Tax=Pleuronectes platessa TaxID=8262 RepID=A0A9N7YK03_PLEPL|nr:unnamed protein product [Pleuronectes platessa]